MVEDGGVVGRRAAGVRVVVVVGAVAGVCAVRVALGRAGPAVAQMSDLAGRAVGDEPAVLQRIARWTTSASSPISCRTVTRVSPCARSP